MFDNLEYLFTSETQINSMKVFIVCITLLVEIILSTRSVYMKNIMTVLCSLLLIYLVMVTVVEFPFYFTLNFLENQNNRNINLFNINSLKSLVSTFCIYFFNFANNVSALEAIRYLKGKSTKRYSAIVKYSQLTVAGVLYILMLFGYLSTLDDTSEIYINKDPQSVFVVIGKVFFSIGLIIYSSFNYTSSKKFLERYIMFGYEVTEEEHKSVIGLIVLGILTAISYKINSVFDFFSLAGASSQATLTIFVPLLLYYQNERSSVKRFSTIMLFAFLLVLCSYNVFEWVIYYFELFAMIFK